MGYVIEINGLLKLPKNFETKNLKAGQTLHIEKSGEHFYALHKPVEFCDANYHYIGKVQIDRLTIEKDKTIIDATVLKVFSKKVADVFSNEFIKQK